MTTRMPRLIPAATLVALTFGQLPRASAIVLDASADTWIRQSSPATDYGDDWISVRASETDTRYGIVEFDLSSTVGVSITSIALELFDSSSSANVLFEQSAFVLSETPPEIDGYTWQEYLDFDQANEQPLQALGAFSIEPSQAKGGYQISSSASAADIALLETVRDANDGRVLLILKGSSGSRDWLDVERDSGPRLWINEFPPVFGDLNGDGVIDAADFTVITDPANWLQEVTPGTRGDLTSNGFVDLADFHAFKTTYLEQQGQAPAAAVPEPASAMLLLLGSWAAALARRERLGSTCRSDS